MASPEVASALAAEFGAKPAEEQKLGGCTVVLKAVEGEPELEYYKRVSIRTQCGLRGPEAWGLNTPMWARGVGYWAERPPGKVWAAGSRGHTAPLASVQGGVSSYPCVYAGTVCL